MSEFKVTSITNRDGSHGPQICGVVTFTGSGLTLPNGGLSGGRGRMVTYGGSDSSSYFNSMNVIQIATLGSAIDFGDASKVNGFSSGMASSTRGVFKQGRGAPSYTDTLEFVTFSSLGGVTEFGTDLGASQDSSASSANGIRGIFGNGTSYDAKIQSITLTTTGDTSEFGTLSQGLYMGGGAGGGSPTRGFFFGGREQPPSTTVVKDIETVSFASGGAASKFGDLTVGRRAIAAVTNSTRAVMCSGDLADGQINVMDYITITSEGNALDFGDITRQPHGYGAGGSSRTRGVITGCDSSPTDSIDFITFSTTGNATDFGDTTYASYLNGACSDLHGGLAE